MTTSTNYYAALNDAFFDRCAADPELAAMRRDFRRFAEEKAQEAAAFLITRPGCDLCAPAQPTGDIAALCEECIDIYLEQQIERRWRLHFIAMTRVDEAGGPAEDVAV